MDEDTTSLGLSAFSSIIDLFRTCSTAIDAWKSLKDLDDDLWIVKTRLMIQKETLEHWQRDWYEFGVTGGASIQRMKLLKSHEDTVQLALQSITKSMDHLEPLRQVAAKERQLNTFERVEWIAKQKKEVADILQNVDSLLDGLYRLLPPANSSFVAPEVILVSNASPAELQKFDTLGYQPPSGSDSLVRITSLKRFESSLRVDLEDRVQEFQVKLPSPDLQIMTSRVSALRADDNAYGLRSFGKLDAETPVIVEWKKYNASWRGQSAIRLKGRLDNLARLLHAESKPRELLTLRCVGYFDAPVDCRFGLIFSYPSASDGNVISLKALLDHPTAETLPSLEERFRAAYTISVSLFMLHTANWLHKSIRCHNIIFPLQNDRVLWALPYMAGFEFSRPNKPGEVSEKLEQSARFNLYRHLQAQGVPAESFREAFDVYSLGVILLEIGLWRSAWRLRDDGMSPETIHQVFVEKASWRLAHFMGTEYQMATLKCLKGDLEKRDHGITRALFIEVIEVLGRLL